jgi:hypothetical protein
VTPHYSRLVPSSPSILPISLELDSSDDTKRLSMTRKLHFSSFPRPSKPSVHVHELTFISRNTMPLYLISSRPSSRLELKGLTRMLKPWGVN